MELQARPYQAEAVQVTQKHLKATKKHGIISVATAGGKSIIIAKLCEWCAAYPNYNVIVLTHRKELLEQNFSKIVHDSVGIVSAGLGKKEWDKQIIVAGIQSVWKKPEKFKNVKLILVDECQAIENNKNGKSRYWKFLNNFPDARIIGLSGTPFRLKDGGLKWGKLIYHIGYKELLELGFVTPLTNKIAYSPDTSKLKIQSGEFVVSEMDKLYLEDEVVFQDAILKIITYGADRKCWIGFVPSIKMAELTKKALEHYGITTEMVNSKTKKKERKKILQDYKDGKIQCMVNVNVLTEGFDNPNIDLLFCFRPTLSLGLWHQILGRSVRLSPSKKDALILDFSGNLKTHGSLADESWKFLDGEVIMPTESNKGKACPACESYVKVVDNRCIDCGHEFEIEIRQVTIRPEPDTKTDLNTSKKIYKWANVTRIDFEENYRSKKGNIIPLKIIYTCGFSQIYEFIFNEQEAQKRKVKKPIRLKINTISKYPEIVEYDYGS
jgi:DNA repair protein RadD